MAVRHDLLAAAEDPADLGRNFAKRLVVATDFSDAAERAFLSAFDRPIEVIGELYLLHVAEMPDDLTAEKKLAVLVARAQQGVRPCGSALGDPAQRR
jgi:nucleotide-binding universal stress UspA family protein